MRKVGTESSRSYQEKLDNGFFQKYMSGNGLEIGYAGYTPGIVPILETAIGVDIEYPGYDGRTLPFPDGSQDYVYSSHVLEHIEDYDWAINEWWRVLKIGGHIVIVVPHQYLYEKKKQPPSKFNGDHRRFYTPAKLLAEIEKCLQENSYRVRLLEDNDKGYDYTIPPQKHSAGAYEITLVLEKITITNWRLL